MVSYVVNVLLVVLSSITVERVSTSNDFANETELVKSKSGNVRTPYILLSKKEKSVANAKH